MTLDDVARMRLEAISFFIVAFLICAGLVQWGWNALRRDFQRLPTLTYGKALTMLGLWGLIFVLVLTMISGARELMTPGAWRKDGYTYKLNRDLSTSEAEQQMWERIESERWSKLAELKVALWAYAKSYDGQLPTDAAASGIADALWRTPEPSGIRYRYIGGRRVNEGVQLVVCEPSVFPSPRLGLTSDGQIRRMTDQEVLVALEGEVKP